jgi:limonene-1,2-epoxide hydrolase
MRLIDRHVCKCRGSRIGIGNRDTPECYRADGSRINSVRAVGLLEMDGPKILRFSDYFDTRQSGMKPAS